MRLTNLPWTYQYYASLPIRHPNGRKSKSSKRRLSAKSNPKKYHHIRVAAPYLFKDIRTITFGKGIKARVGFRKGASKSGPRKGKSEIQSLLFTAELWSFSEAKTWARSHGYKILKRGTEAADTKKSKLVFDPKLYKEQEKALKKQLKSLGIPWKDRKMLKQLGVWRSDLDE